MNLFRTIKELSNHLDVVYPSYSSSSTSNEIRHDDGINYWKGKKIISAKKWNEIYEKNSIYTDNYKIILSSRKPLQYFPDEYNGSISSFNEELKEETQKWNKEYYELLEFRKNPNLGRNKCSGCIFSTDLDDPLFVGIGKVVARIVSNQCNNNNNNNILNSISNTDNDLISYPCRVMNFFQCPFESTNNNQYPYTKEKLFALQRVAFAIEQAISIFHETTKNNEIIYEVDFENDKVHEIHTKYNGESESWGWHENVNEQLSKVKPISNIIIRDEQDIFNILTNREKLEYLIEEFENQLDIESQDQENEIYNENLKPELKIQMKKELKKHKEEQLILLKENKISTINFVINNKDSIRIEDLKIYEPIYKCYREKGICRICNSLSNIICKNCYNNYNYSNNKEIWYCVNHWKQHAMDNHIR